MLKCEINTWCSEEELEKDVVQIILKRSVSHSDDDKSGSWEVMVGKLWNKTLREAILLLRVSYMDIGNIFQAVLGYRMSSYTCSKLVEVAFCAVLADSMSDQVLLERDWENIVFQGSLIKNNAIVDYYLVQNV